MTRSIAALALLLPALTASAQNALNPSEADALIGRMREHRAKFPTLTADFTEEKTIRLLKKPVSNFGTLAFEAPNKFRREMKGPNPSLTVSNGQKLWIYYPYFKEAELYTLGTRGFFDDSIAALTAGLNFQNISEFYRYDAFRDGDGYRFQLRPRSGGLKRMVHELTVFVTPDFFFFIRRTDAELPKGDRVSTIYRNQKSTPLPPGTFEFRPPPDAHISTPLGK